MFAHVIRGSFQNLHERQKIPDKMHENKTYFLLFLSLLLGSFAENNLQKTLLTRLIYNVVPTTVIIATFEMTRKNLLVTQL